MSSLLQWVIDKMVPTPTDENILVNQSASQAKAASNEDHSMSTNNQRRSLQHMHTVKQKRNKPLLDNLTDDDEYLDKLDEDPMIIGRSKTNKKFRRVVTDDSK